MLLQLSLTSIISSLTKTPPQAKILFLLTTYHHHSTLSLKSSLEQRKNACNQTQSNGEGEKKDSRLNATTSSKRKMLLEYWIVIDLLRNLFEDPFLRRVVFPAGVVKLDASLSLMT
ncbi:hypothetical protein C5167_035244 [Papaver somniferum]|uniref:Uncharacterized protein n=1 Tax=Papaver somniferum TaxID=3469 RepID=A0A4Y7KGV6_PAPSO|nr:hypothetical protein C5167_035244 [Papaver somniferum]